MQTLSLSRARTHSSQQLSSSPKATFDRGKELSLQIFFLKQREKDIEKAYLFPLSRQRDKKKPEESTQKREKNSPFQHRLHGPKIFFRRWRCAQTKTLPLNTQRERRVDFKLAQKQPHVLNCYDASGRARVWTRCGSDRARFPDEKERAHFLCLVFFSFCARDRRKSFSLLPIPVIKNSLSLSR